MHLAIADTSTLAALSGIHRLDLLHARYERVFAPQAVFDEVVTNATNWLEVADAQEAMREATWLLVCTCELQASLNFSYKLGAGEREAISTAYGMGLPVLLDDRAARKAAKAYGLITEGSLGVLEWAKLNGLVAFTRPLVEGMIANGRRLSPTLLTSHFIRMNEHL